MARRTTKTAKCARRPAENWKLPYFRTFPELPGAVFVGARPKDYDLEQARHMQAVRADFEETDCLTTLRLALSREGFGRDEISAIFDPRTITSCVYNVPISRDPIMRSYIIEAASLAAD
jgi:hypothetical protein